MNKIIIPVGLGIIIIVVVILVLNLDFSQNILQLDLVSSSESSSSYEVNTLCDLILILEGPSAAVFWDNRYSDKTIQKYASEKQQLAEKIAEQYLGIKNYTGSWHDLPPIFWQQASIIDEKILKDESFHHQINPDLIEEYGGLVLFLDTVNNILHDEESNC